jgi:hypothetical protein
MSTIMANVQSVMELEGWLSANFDGDVPMPCRGKQPAYPFASKTVWDWSRWRHLSVSNFPRSQDSVTDSIGVLLDKICVVDVDDAQTAKSLEARFPVLQTVPKAQTRRGAHYWFLRSSLADAQGFFTSASAVTKGVDFKSIHSTGTRSFVVVPPSADKTWIVAPWQVPCLVPIPDDLLRAVALPTHPAPRDLRVKCMLDGSTLNFPGDMRLQSCAYIVPFVEDGIDGMSDDDAVCLLPASFSGRDLVLLNDVLEARATKRERRTRPPLAALDRIPQLVQLADFLGVPEKWMKQAQLVPSSSSVKTGPTVWDAARCLRDVDPLWARACFSRSQPTAVLDVRGPLEYAPLDRDARHGTWLLPECKSAGEAAGLRSGDNVLVPRDDVAGLAWSWLPGPVRTVLQRNAGRAVVAGGWVLGTVCPHVQPGTDLDIFVVGDSPADGNKVVADAIGALAGRTNSASVTGAAVTVAYLDSEYDEEQLLQVVLRLHGSVSAVLDAFDLDPCRVALWWDAAEQRPRVQANPAWFFSVKHLAMWIDTDAWSTASVSRAFKYYCKGLDVLLPGCDRRSFQALLQPSAWTAEGERHIWQPFADARRWLDRRRMSAARSRFPGVFNLLWIELALSCAVRSQTIVQGRALRPPAELVTRAVRQLTCWGCHARSGYDQLLEMRGVRAMFHALGAMAQNAWLWIVGTSPAPTSVMNKNRNAERMRLAADLLRNTGTTLEAGVLAWPCVEETGGVLYRRSPAWQHVFAQGK